MSQSKKIAMIGNQCVACGNCAKYCPLSAISMKKGLFAAVDHDKCVGCGKCANACPAAVIEIVAREEVHHEKALV